MTVMGCLLLTRIVRVSIYEAALQLRQEIIRIVVHPSAPSCFGCLLAQLLYLLDLFAALFLIVA